MNRPLTDAFARRLSYLRLSITDLCNFRCSYCLPQGYAGKAQTNELSLPEIETLVRVFARSGTRKIRLTGGEPTLRRDLPQIIAACRAEPLVESIGLTTNGWRLGKDFAVWRTAGLDKLNVSIDSFDAQTFQKITGKNLLAQIIRDVDAVLATGFSSLKINTLLLRNTAEETFQAALKFVAGRPVTLRFIELMQTGDLLELFQNEHLPAARLENRLIENGWQLMPRSAHAGPAREYSHPAFAGGIGFIAPYSKDFCTRCNRLRVSAQGRMHLCLFGGTAYDLRPFLAAKDEGALADFLQQTVAQKPEQHYLHDKKVGLIRNLSMIGG